MRSSECVAPVLRHGRAPGVACGVATPQVTPGLIPGRRPARTGRRPLHGRTLCAARSRGEVGQDLALLLKSRVETLQLAAECPGLVQQLPGGGAARDLLRLARRAQALIERLDGRV